jgi:1-acylglycerol-3-phosphate O-acyltransferase
MEKFNDWRDKGTGIHPFLYPLGVKPSIFKTICGSFLAIVKLTFIVLLVPIWYLLQQISKVFLIEAIVGTLHRFWSWTFGRLVLFLLGFHHINVQSRNRPIVKKWKLFIANHSSYLDFLILDVLYQPTFIVVSEKGVAPVSLWNVGSSSLLPIPFDSFMSKYHAKGKPVIIFPEGTTSNGRSILEFQPIFSNEIFNHADVHVLSVKYSYLN